MQDYELVLIVSPEMDEEQASGTVEGVTNFITEKGGIIGEVNHWGKRKLGYPINHLSEGDYFLALFKLEPEFTKELEDKLKLSRDIIRHLLVKAES